MLLSGRADGESNLFCSKLLSKVMGFLEVVFPTPKTRRASSSSLASYSLPALLGDSRAKKNPLFDFARLYIASYGALASISRTEQQKPVLHNKLIKRFLNTGKFKFLEMESDIQVSIQGFLKGRYGDLVTMKIPSKPKIEKTHIAKKKTKTRRKGKGKGKAKNRRKTGYKPKPEERTSQKEDTAAQETPQDVSLDVVETAEGAAAIVIEREEADATIEDKVISDVAPEVEVEAYEFNFNEWYKDEILSRIRPAYASDEEEDEEGAAEKSIGISAALPKFVFNAKARAFYQAVMGSAERPVSKSDFEAFLRAVGGGYGAESKSGSAVGYWLPNLSGTRERNPYLKFMVHLPHSGSEAFPLKTLKYFLKRAFMTCAIDKGVSL
ncbi:MAG TPA: hypothetical protein DD412_08625 [Holosporales bacterium]|nr:hypothetical protein [Holosporales bacterium]